MSLKAKFKEAKEQQVYYVLENNMLCVLVVRLHMRVSMGRCWLWGAGPPQTFNAQVGCLPGLSVWSLHVLPVFTRGFLH